jgi:hypothetical protein
MKSLLKTGAPIIVAAFALPLLFLSGCLSLEKLTGYFKQDPCYTHTVRWPGENLYIIAKWYTGNGENWKILARANPELDPDRIRVGETIRVPEKIMQTKKPLPQGFVQSRSETPAGRVSSKPPEEPPRLFGPKPYPSQ